MTQQAGSVYQLCVVLADISPLIWRGLAVTGSTTLAELHRVIQAAFGWDEDNHEFLHEFTVHGASYGTSGGCSWTGGEVSLDDLGLRKRERFVYEYNFFAGWRHDIRVEKVAPAAAGKHYPACTGGARRVPPPQCESPADYMQLRADKSFAVIRMAEIMGELLDMPEDTTLNNVPELRDELRELVVYGELDDFDRPKVDRTLRTLRLNGVVAQQKA